jgi:lipopolysaccharide export system permease protein
MTHAACSCSADQRRRSLTSARGGQLASIGDDRFLVLERGQRTQFDRKTGERTLASFQRYQILAEDRHVNRASARSPRTIRTIDLIRDPSPRNQGELTWRLGLLFGAVNLTVLGVGLAAINPRRDELNPGVRHAGFAFITTDQSVEAWLLAD